MKPGVRPPYKTAKPASDLQRPAPLPTHTFRNVVIVFLVGWSAFLAYAYSQDPAGCQKVLADSRDVVTSLIGGKKTTDTKFAPIVGASISTPSSHPETVLPPPVAITVLPVKTATPAVAVTETPAPAATSDSAPVPDPDALPARPNWTWTTLDGKIYRNVVITKMEPETISITHDAGVAHIPMMLLSDDIKQQLHYDPQAAAAQASKTAIASMLDGKLVDATGAPVPVPDATIQYYAVYYSAAWCPPCHAFTPKLVAWYNKFKPVHPNFELIFVSSDTSPAAMLGYMKEMRMPWPALDFSAVTHTHTGIEKYAGSGIPDLVLIDAGGKVLSDSFRGEQYLGPGAVVADINKIVGGTSPVPLVLGSLPANVGRLAALP